MRDIVKLQRLENQARDAFTKTHLIYYLMQTLPIGLITAFYCSLAYGDLICWNESGESNIGVQMTVVCRASFFISLAAFLTSAFLGPYIELLIPLQDKHSNPKTNFHFALKTVLLVTEWILRAALIFLASWQLFMV